MCHTNYLFLCYLHTNGNVLKMRLCQRVQYNFKSEILPKHNETSAEHKAAYFGENY